MCKGEALRQVVSDTKSIEHKFSALYSNLWHYIVYAIDGQLDMNDSACVNAVEWSSIWPALLGTNR